MEIKKIKFKDEPAGTALDLWYEVKENGHLVEYQAKREERVSDIFESKIGSLKRFFAGLVGSGTIYPGEIKLHEKDVYSFSFFASFSGGVFEVKTQKMTLSEFKNGERIPTREGELIREILDLAESYANGENGEAKLFDLRQNHG